MSTTPRMDDASPIAGHGLPGFPATPLPADRFGRRFWVGVAGMLVALAVLYWAMWRWEETAWFAKEDGVVEYATAAALAAGGAACVLAGRLLRRMGHRNLGAFHFIVAVAFTIGALEEISWGQRIFGWDTPGAISDVNRQGETTLHNIAWLEAAVYTAVAWMSIAAIAGGGGARRPAPRGPRHHRRLHPARRDNRAPAGDHPAVDQRRAAPCAPRAPLPRRRVGVRRPRIGARRRAVRSRRVAARRSSAPRTASYQDVSSTSDAISSPTSSSERPIISRRTCSLCWPTVGAAHASRPGVRDRLNWTPS